MAYQQLPNKVIAITGAGSGIGQAVAIMAVERGAKVSLADVSQAGLDKTAETIRGKLPAGVAFDDRVLISAVDVRKYEQVEAWITATVSRFGRLDGAANLAGVVPKDIGLKTIAEMDFEQWEFVFSINVTGVMHCLRAETAVIADNGSIVNAASVAGVSGRARNANYSASKHAVVGLTRSVAKEVGPRGIRCNAIAPGPIDTPMMANASKIVDDGAKAGNAGAVTLAKDTEMALGRHGRPEEVAHLVSYLLSDESTYVSGQIVGVDGGWTC